MMPSFFVRAINLIFFLSETNQNFFQLKINLKNFFVRDKSELFSTSK